METIVNPLEELSLLRLIRSSARTNEQILNQLKFFRSIVGRLNIAIFIHDLKLLHHIWTNNNYINILGYTDSEIKSFGPEWAKDNYHPDDFHILKERIEYFRENKGDTYSGIYRAKHKQGHWVWIYSNSTVFKRDEEGKPEHIIGICIDFARSFKTETAFDEFYRENHRQRNCKLIASLTPREKEILQMVASGKSNREIAEAFNISCHTVNSHRKNLFSKLNIHNTGALGRFAAECGLD
ncbi:MAG: PAS domain-containing protein [Bacteroidales bacterium]|nr:PAS domain-containing protein [Bacteroidales bacterium]